MCPSDSPHIRYAAAGGQLYIAFEGGPTHRVSLTADQLASEFMSSNPPQPMITLDLADCSWVDSTFAGWMIKLRQRLMLADGRLVVSHCPKACRSSLEVMGLTGLFDFQSVDPSPRAERVACPGEAADAGTIAFVLDAHQRLADANPENRRVFSPIVDMLRDELKKKRT